MHLLAQVTPPLDLPEVDWRAIAPELALLTAGIVTLLWVAFVIGRADGAFPTARGATAAPAHAATGSGSRVALGVLTLLGLAAAAALTAWNWDLASVAFGGDFAQDGITRTLRVVLIAVGTLATLMAMADARRDQTTPPEVFPLLLFALSGMSLFAAASDLLVAFIALEILSLSLYVLAGATRHAPAREAALKYFLLGAFSSAFLLYGIALVYGAVGTTGLREIAVAVGSAELEQEGLLLAGVALLAVGFLFKVAAVPFHMWTPDVYDGAPLSVTAFMAAGTKAAGFAAFLRVFVGALGGLAGSWRPAIAAVAVATMLVGAVLAMVQTSIKRMLAYSSIAHAGFLLVGVAAASSAGIEASMYYLAAYALMVMGAFMVVQYASHAGGEERTSLEDYRGFGRRHPVAGALLALFLFSLAGVPPALSGFWAKYLVFQAGVDAGLTWLVVVGVLASAAAAFFYLRVVVVAYLQEPSGAEEPPSPSPALGVALGLASVLTVAIGFAPQLVVGFAETAGRILG